MLLMRSNNYLMKRDNHLSVSDHLPRLDKDDNVFRVHEELADEFIISVDDTVSALRKVKTNKSTGPDNIPAWVLKEHADCLAAPLASILVCFLSVFNVHFCKKSPKLAQMTFDRYLSNHDIGRTFWGGLTPSN